MTGSYDPTSEYLLSNVSVISRVPYFLHTISLVSVLVSANGPENTGHVLTVFPNLLTTNEGGRSFAQMDEQPSKLRVNDPDLILDADNFGFMVSQYAMNSNRTINLAQAMNHTFSVLYATFATLSTYDALPENITSAGLLLRPVNRLFVVILPAIIVTVVVDLSLLVTIWIAFHAYRCRETLKSTRT